MTIGQLKVKNHVRVMPAFQLLHQPLAIFGFINAAS